MLETQIWSNIGYCNNIIIREFMSHLEFMIQQLSTKGQSPIWIVYLQNNLHTDTHASLFRTAEEDRCVRRRVSCTHRPLESLLTRSLPRWPCPWDIPDSRHLWVGRVSEHVWRHMAATCWLSPGHITWPPFAGRSKVVKMAWDVCETLPEP